MAKSRPGEPGGVGGPGPCARLTREVLDRLASPEVRDAILSGALRTADLTEVPDEPSAFGSFACGPLRDCVEAMLGAEEAAAVTADLGPAFTVDETTARSSGVRRRKQRASLAAPSEGAPVVLVASEVPALVDTLVTRLKSRAKVIATYDLFALLSAATQQSNAQVVLLLHDEMAGLKPSSLNSLSRMLPAGTRVIVWGGAGIRLENREAPVEWIELGNVEDVEAVADVCIASWPSKVIEPEPARRVVLAHPDATWRARASRLLMDAGYTAVSAPDGFLALERCIEETPSAVIAAFSMDALDGPQLASLVKSRFGENAPPVLLVADGLLPEPPRGAVAVIQNDALEEDLLPELAAWIGSG